MHHFNPPPLSGLNTRDAGPASRPTSSRLRWLLALALAATGLTGNEAAAETWDFPQPHPVGEINVTTRIVLRGVTGIYDAPPPPVVHPVHAGSRVEIATPFEDAYIVSIRWLKNGEPLASTAKTLVLDDVTADDSGLYTAEIRREVEPAVLYASTVEQIELRVGEGKPQKLINLSLRATIDQSNRSLTAGFVIDGDSRSASSNTFLLIRAVGPTLADHGVPNPLASPKVELFDARGQKVEWPDFYIPEWDPYFLATAVAPAVGAAPLRANAGDFSILQALAPGAYTLRLSSADGGSGDAVLELFEVSEEVVTKLPAVILPPADTKG